MADSLDEYDFTPSASTNLRSLFHNSIDISDNSSLIYTAPKQPKSVPPPEVKNETPKADSSVICARVVQAWKLANGKYVGIGKLGFAIIGSSGQNTCEIILYKEKRDVIMRTRVNSNFEISLRKDDFVSLYDTAKDNWLIKFDKTEDRDAVMTYIEKYGGKVVTTDSCSATEKPVGKTVATTTPKENTPKNGEVLDNADNKTRADILTRIAKMGQSILPGKDLNPEDEFYEPANTQPVQINKEIPQVSSALSTFAPTKIVHGENIPNTFVYQQPMTCDPLSIFVAENRTQNSELRMNLSQISDKLNCIMKLVDGGKSVSDVDNNALTSKIKVLELRTENLLKELRTAQQENAQLKLRMEQKNSILELEEQSQLKIKLLEEEMKVKTDALQQQVMEYEKNMEQHSKVIENQKGELEGLQLQLESYQSDVQWKDEILKLENTITELEKKLREFEEKEQNSETFKSHSEIDKEKKANFTLMIKTEMNALYANIVENFSEEEQNKAGQNIKSATLRIIQNFQQLYENETV